MKLLIAIALFIPSFFSFQSVAGQTREYSITGTIQDSADHHPLPLATVYVRNPKDSSLVSFALTDEQGNFTLKNIPGNKSLSFMIFYTGYKKYRKRRLTTPR